MAVLALIGGLVLLGALAAASVLLVSSSTGVALTGHRESRAHYLALSGLNLWSVGRTGRFRVGDDTVTLSQSGPDAQGYYTVTSLGCVQPASALEANAVVTARRLGQSPATITYTNDLVDFDLPVVGKTVNKSSAITVYAANTEDEKGGGSHAMASAGYTSGSIRLGGGKKETQGAIWYTGSKSICEAGQCAFGTGLRAYFGFVFFDRDASKDSRSKGDGFTFTIMHAAGNDPATAAGGATSSRMGEYLGYAGPGPSGVGIAAPKLAVEVDVLPNTGAYPPDHVDSRRDHSTANHIAVVFWGDTGLDDDNVHGLGSLPVNPTINDPEAVGYYEVPRTAGLPNWLEDTEEHTFRLEIERADSDTGGTYRIKVWIDGTGASIDDVTQDYTATPPQLDYTAKLDAADHAKFDTIYFGWTEATGDAAQDIAIHDFSLAFRR